MQLRPKLLGEKLYGPEFGYRENTPVPSWPINMIFNMGGMGDFLNYSAATTWIAKNCPWIHGRIFCPNYLVPIMTDIHAQFKDWKVFPSEKVEEFMEHGTSYLGPNIYINGQTSTKQFMTCAGAHQIDVAFSMYAGTTAPPDACLPMIDYPESRLHPKIKRLKGKYIVLPTGGSAESRTVPGRLLNPLIHYIKELGFTPVFLGKKDLLGDGLEITKFPSDIDYAAGIDLRNQTSVKDAACIMQHAAMTVGLDCGLLHLAAMMKDSKVIFGYNVTSIEHRLPRRKWGKLINITLTESELRCIGCQSKFKLYPLHNFSKCLYGDNKCVELLFENGAERFKRAIDRMLKS